MTTTPETTTNTPAAWIGCLSCYNNGQLRGQWITAQQAADEMTGDEITYAGQAETITTGDYTAPRCRKCGGDEFDVFDTEHLPTKMTAAEFYRNAETLAALDDAGDLERITTLAAWLGGSMTLDDLTTYDADNYAGQWDTFQDYAESYANDVALLADTPEWIARYFNMEAFGATHDDAPTRSRPTGHEQQPTTNRRNNP